MIWKFALTFKQLRFKVVEVCCVILIRLVSCNYARPIHWYCAQPMLVLAISVIASYHWWGVSFLYIYLIKVYNVAVYTEVYVKQCIYFEIVYTQCCV